MAFAKSKTFNNGSQFPPWEPVQDFKSRFPEDTKFMISIGGWGDIVGFSDAVKSNVSIRHYAENVAAMVTSVGADGVGKLAPVLLKDKHGRVFD
jgi:chitinase